jgi:hypothetical protein
VRFVLLVYENNVALHCSVQEGYASKKEIVRAPRAPDLEFRHQSQAWLTQITFCCSCEGDRIDKSQHHQSPIRS